MRGNHPVIFGITVALVLVFGSLLSLGCSDKGGASSSEDANKMTPAVKPPSAPAVSAPASQPANPQVVIDTNFGAITVELFPQRAPATVANFLRYVDESFYVDLLFHRVMQNFMIQGGGFTPDGQQKPPTHAPVTNESAKAGSNLRGTIAMARTQDLHSATCQFFINTVDNKPLDYPNGGGYTVFGRVVSGMEVVDKIAAVPVQPSAISNAQPLNEVVIRSIRRL